MNQSHDDKPMPLERSLENELYGLLARLCDGELTESERDRINEILNDYAAARRIYLRYIALHGLLANGAGGPVGCSVVDTQLAVERLAVSKFSEGIVSQPEVSRTPVVGARGRWPRFAVHWIAAVSAVVLIAAALFWQMPRQGGSHPENKAIAVAQGQSVERTTLAEPEPLVAEVTYVSDGPTWQNPNNSYVVASQVRSGQILLLERGQIELTYETGTKLLLTGPTEFVVQRKGGKLRRGEVVARVPQAGHGFTIETPHGKVIDLGTEFGVVVDDFGVSQVSVFEGKVETLAAGTKRDAIELTSGNAIQWTDKAFVPIDFQASGYQFQKSNRPATMGTRAVAASVADDFRSDDSSLATKWKTIGNVVQGNGLRMGTGKRTGQRPYLLSAREFNPSYGAVTVTCDVRFEQMIDTEQPSFAILTRSSSQVSTPSTAWHDMLARSMRCRFGGAPPMSEGRLEVGTKQEPDCAPSSLSWGGFSRPQPGKLYRLEMRDDGVNVAFSVALAENPSVRKTITCRSLFRSNENFVAFEGSDGVAVVLEHVTISQERPSLEVAESIAANPEGESPTTAGMADMLADALNDLAPNDAEIVLAEDFDGNSLNPEKWIALGDVVVKDGHAQLGLPNAEQHIDTWREHPYLLSRQDFDPHEGPLVILGSVEFSPNFLHGYGGTFSTMTRADRTRGGARGWTNSILRRGIRFNFWPAAFGFDHSLEIHEKPSLEQITLLTAAGFDISPQARVYLFKVVDDGDTATLAMFDATKVQVQKSISAGTTNVAPTAGSIAFESCWGSPIKLDSIRVYRAKTSAPASPSPTP